jgi:hypothetical protein
MVPTATITLHLIDALKVRVEPSFSKPLILSVETQYGRTDLTLFFRDEGMSAILAEAIQSAIDIRAIETSEPPAVDLRQVYAAEAYAYRGTDR